MKIAQKKDAWLASVNFLFILKILGKTDTTTKIAVQIFIKKPECCICLWELIMNGLRKHCQGELWIFC